MAFSIAGITRLDALAAVQEHLAKAIEGGQTFAQWKKALLADPQALSVATLPRHRLDNIFRTNTQAAYLRGITRQQDSPGALKRRPFFQYDAINDSRTRPAHAAMDNHIAPADDPVWKRWTPPSGYRCRCIRLAITEAEARARGWNGSPKPVPSEPDAGFAGHPLDGDGWAGIQQAVAQRLGKPNTGPARDNLLVQAAWAKRGGALPEPNPLDLPALRQGQEAPALFERFMDEFGGGASELFTLPAGQRVLVGDDLFKDLNGHWKIGKRGRDEWLLYLAALIKAPQEAWQLPLAMLQELYLLGRFQRAGRTLEALVVFELANNAEPGRPWVGKTAFVSDREKYLGDKRSELINKKATLLWLDA